jgi:D-3-phosphoglycerate dehydrogenase
MAHKSIRLMAPSDMSADGWDIINARSDIEAIPFNDDEPSTALHSALQDVDGIILGHVRFSAVEIAIASKLRAVGRLGVGVDSVDVPALTARHIPLVTTDAANSASVAEHTLGFMLLLAKQMIEMDAIVRQGRWHDRSALRSIDFCGKTVLIVGFGRIGTRLATRCLAMEMNVVVFDPAVGAIAASAHGCEVVHDLDAGLSRADFVCVLCPKNDQTLNLFNADRLKQMKKSAFLINTARGGIVDEVALYDALSAGEIAGAAFDVFAEEPVFPEHPLLSLRNFIAAPHLAGTTVEAKSRMARTAVNGVIDALDGRVNAKTVYNPEVL